MGPLCPSLRIAAHDDQPLGGCAAAGWVAGWVGWRQRVAMELSEVRWGDQWEQ